MSEKLEVLETWFRRVWEEEDESAIDEMFKPGAQAKGLGDKPLEGPEDFKMFHRNLLRLLCDVKLEVTESMESGDKLCAICIFRAKSRNGENPLEMTGSVYVTISGGKITHAYNHFDFISLYEGLGLLPENTFASCLTGNSAA